MRIKINGEQINSLTKKIEDGVETTIEELNKHANRETKRSKHFKKIIGLVTFMGTVGVASVAKADPAIDNPITTPTGPLSFILEKVLKFIDVDINVKPEDTFMWKFNKYLGDTLFQTQNMFTDPDVLYMFHVIWSIVLSFTTLIVGKKGYDMVKARLMGSQSQGGMEFIIRLLISGLLTFLSLDLMSVGITLTNLTVNLFMKKMSGGFFHFTNALQIADANMGSMFWTLGFIVMFAILGVRYWARQINIMLLGLMAPIASMAWVTDSGAMMATLVKEFMIHLTTPLAQAGILMAGTRLLMRVGTVGDSGFLNSILIGLSTMCLMFVTPDFIRKFTTGSFNPFKSAVDAFVRMKAMPLSMLKMIK